MNPVDVILVAVIVVIAAAAVWFILKSKKSGKMCIGCPDSCACSGGNCNGGCNGCKER